MTLVVASPQKPVGQMMHLVNPCSFTSFPAMLGLSISKVGWDKCLLYGHHVIFMPSSVNS